MKRVQNFYFPGAAASNYELYTINDFKIVPLIQKQNYEQANQLLSSLLAINTNLDKNNEKNLQLAFTNTNLDNSQQQEIPKNIDLISSSVLCYNKGLTLWKINKKEESIIMISKYLQNMREVLKNIVQIQKNIAYRTQTIKVSLQYCVFLSQIGDHQNSEQIAKNTLCDICYVLEQMSDLASILQNDLISDAEQCNKRKSRLNLLNIARSKIDKLEQISSIQTYNFEDHKQKNKQIIQNLYSWQSSTQNNQKFLKKMLKIPDKVQQLEQRNSIGLSKIPQWIQNFSIGSLMDLKPKKIEVSISFDPYYLLSSTKILQLAVYCSVCLFAIATEIRFQKNSTIFKGISQSQKYLKMNQDKEITQCKILHVKAIEVAVRFIPSSKMYNNHLICSFNKNYKFFMEKIEQQAQSHLVSNYENNQEMKTIIWENMNKCSDDRKVNLHSQKSLKSLNQSKKSQNKTRNKNNQSKNSNLKLNRKSMNKKKRLFTSSQNRKTIKNRSKTKQKNQFIAYTSYF